MNIDDRINSISRLVNWRIRELVVDSRLRGNDKKQISVLIGVNPRLMTISWCLLVFIRGSKSNRPFDYAQGILIGNKHV